MYIIKNLKNNNIIKNKNNNTNKMKIKNINNNNNGSNKNKKNIINKKLKYKN